MALPRGVTALALRVARWVPDAILTRVLPRRLEFVVPPAVSFADQPVRLFIGPVNFARQGYAWAHAAKTLPGVDAVSMAYQAGTGYGFDIDQRVPASVYLLSRSWANKQRTAILSRATHVIIEAGRHIFGDVYGTTVNDEIEMLRRAGIRVALLSHGSDARRPQAHIERVPDSPYADPAWGLVDQLEKESAAHHALMAQSGADVFVSTPGMLDDVPTATWLPVVIDVDHWQSSMTPLDNDVPLVVHAPSSPIVKGTHAIEPIVKRLVNEGLIRYERLTGVPADEVPAFFARADIVLDQFRLGDYGVAACEALASGRLVIGNVTDDNRARVRAVAGEELPIMQATIGTLESVLRSVVADRNQAATFASRGPGFVRTVHDGRQAATVLAEFLGVQR